LDQQILTLSNSMEMLSGKLNYCWSCFTFINLKLSMLLLECKWEIQYICFKALSILFFFIAIRRDRLGSHQPVYLRHIVVPVTSQDLDSHCCSCHKPGPGFTLLFLSQARTWIHIVVPVTSQDVDSTTLNMRLWLSFIFLVYYFVFNVYLPLFIYRVYQGTRPTLIIADPDLIRDLFIKEFGNFTNRPVSFIM
jgi:membrane protein implicated in regulation of membrane protease activity